MPIDSYYHVSVATLEHLKLKSNKILIEVFDNRGMTENGLIVPITVDNVFVPTEGTVFKIGSKVDNINVGDKVFFEKYKGTRFFCDERQFLLMDASYVLAILE